MKSLLGKIASKTFITEYFGNELILFPVGTPQNTHFKNVRSEFSVSDWDKIRKKTYRNANYKCELCGESGKDQGYNWNVECHEIWDYDFKSSEQILTDFISLCPLCHKIVHLGLTIHLYENKKMTKQEFDKIINHFYKVNKIDSKEKNIKYIDNCVGLNLEFHRKKHLINWNINIDYAFAFLGGK